MRHITGGFMHIRIEELNRLIAGRRLRLTAVTRGNTPIDQEKLSRFERRVVQVQGPGKHDPDGTIVTRLEKLAPAGCDLKRSDRVYFDPSASKWFAIAGADVRRVLFRALYDNQKDILRQPLALVQLVDKKGAALIAYAEELLQKNTEWFRAR